MPNEVPVRQRMSPERRREQLLSAAADYIAVHGTGFSLDDIAQSAGISPPLMRHYFTNRDGLLVALFEEMLGEIVGVWTAPSEPHMMAILGEYLDWVAGHQWAHRLWMLARSEESVLTPLVAGTRQRLIEAAGGSDPQSSDEQRFRAAAWVAVIETAVQDWLANGATDPDQLAARLLDVATRLGLRSSGYSITDL